LPAVDPFWTPLARSPINGASKPGRRTGKDSPAIVGDLSRQVMVREISANGKISRKEKTAWPAKL